MDKLLDVGVRRVGRVTQKVFLDRRLDTRRDVSPGQPACVIGARYQVLNRFGDRIFVLFGDRTHSKKLTEF